MTGISRRAMAQLAAGAGMACPVPLKAAEGDKQSAILRAEDIAPQVSWGTSPGMVLGVDQRVPDPAKVTDENTRKATERALAYM